jgi:hypothetical protein
VLVVRSEGLIGKRILLRVSVLQSRCYSIGHTESHDTRLEPEIRERHGVILQVLSNLGQVQDDGNSKALEKRPVTNARQFQDLRSFE